MHLLSTVRYSLLAMAIPAFAQSLPEGPGNKATERVCGQCHGIEVFASARKSPDEWDKTINQMIQKGLQITDDDYSTVLEYLGKYLGKTPPKKQVNAR
jgi:cytochrome c5